VSVIAGSSLFQGVILLADSRVTIRRLGRKDVYCDNAQKLFPLSPNSVLGFVGDLKTAAPLIRELLRQIEQKYKQGHAKRVHPLSLLRWLPRYFRSAYKYLSKKWDVGRVDFMIGSVIPEKNNVIERVKVVEIMERFRLGKLSAQRNWLPGILIKILKMPVDKKYIVLSDVPANLLYYMQSPKFVPSFLAPLEYAAIGSGDKVIMDIDRNADWIFAGEVGNSFQESMALRETVSSFIEKNSIISVGGLYPAIKIYKDHIDYLCYSMQIPAGGSTFELSINKDRRWIQKNKLTGKEIKLLFPWEIDPNEYHHDERFDDLKDALSRTKIRTIKK